MPRKKKTKHNLTSRQKQVLSIVQEKVRKGEKINKGKILIDVWYSPSFAKQPWRVFDTQTFREILAEELPNTHLVQIHKRLLHSKRIAQMRFSLDMADETIEDMINACGDECTHIAIWGDEKHGFYKIAYYITRNDNIAFRALVEAYKLKWYYNAPVEPQKPALSLVDVFNRAEELRREREAERQQRMIESTQNGAETI